LDLNQILKTSACGDAGVCPPLYQILAKNKTNIVCMGLLEDAAGTSVFCCHDIESGIKPEVKQGVNCTEGSSHHDMEQHHFSNVCMVSVYPHRSSLNTLGILIQMFGKNRIMFQQMISSNAMITFVIHRSDQKRVVSLLEHEFDLPPTHTPFQQNYNDETAAFVKQRYPETSATYVEEKIKTYGIQMNSGLVMHEIFFNPSEHEHLEMCGKGFQNSAGPGGKFYFTAAMTLSNDLGRLFCLTDSAAGRFDPKMDICRSVDLISFHGPHFGDRFGIFDTAMDCLNNASIKVLLAGCTGASICMVLPEKFGEKAIAALARGFETP